MDRGAAPIWRCFTSRSASSPASRSTSSITATIDVTSRTSTTSSKASFDSSIACPSPILRTGNSSPASSASAPYRLYNIGSNNPIELLRYIEVLEDALGRKAEKRLLPMQPGDVAETYADVSALARDIGYKPSTPIEVGVRQFVDWYRDFYGVNHGG